MRERERPFKRARCFRDIQRDTKSRTNYYKFDSQTCFIFTVSVGEFRNCGKNSVCCSPYRFIVSLNFSCLRFISRFFPLVGKIFLYVDSRNETFTWKASEDAGGVGIQDETAVALVEEEERGGEPRLTDGGVGGGGENKDKVLMVQTAAATSHGCFGPCTRDATVSHGLDMSLISLLTHSLIVPIIISRPGPPLTP